MSSVLLPESHHTSSLMKMSTVIQVIIYFWVATHLFSGRRRIQRQSHHKMKSLPLLVWHDRHRADSLILHVQMNAASNRDMLQSADGDVDSLLTQWISLIFLLLSWFLQIVPHANDIYSIITFATPRPHTPTIREEAWFCLLSLRSLQDRSLPTCFFHSRLICLKVGVNIECGWQVQRQISHTRWDTAAFAVWHQQTVLAKHAKRKKKKLCYSKYYKLYYLLKHL